LDERISAPVSHDLGRGQQVVIYGERGAHVIRIAASRASRRNQAKSCSPQ
jgi:hypothetical protein